MVKIPKCGTRHPAPGARHPAFNYEHEVTKNSQFICIIYPGKMVLYIQIKQNTRHARKSKENYTHEKGNQFYRIVKVYTSTPRKA